MNRDDIARLAGVSSATVSRVINNHKNIRPEVRARVIKIIEKMNYKPNLMARGLKMGNPRTIVYFAPNIRNPYFSEIYMGINDYTSAHGYMTVIHDNSKDMGNIELLAAGKVDGVILGHSIPEIVMKGFSKRDIPTVFLNTASKMAEKDSANSIKIDIFKATENILEYLFSMGHRKIGLIIENTLNNNERLEAYKHVLGKHEIPYIEQQVKFFGGVDFSYNQGYVCMTEFLNEKTDVTAVVANNDLIAIGAMRAVFERELSVPEDYSFVGFDDIQVAGYYNPPLTTVRLFEYEQGLAAGKMLLELIEGREVQSVELDTELVVRESVRKIDNNLLYEGELK